MFDAKRLLFDAVCVAVLAILMIWGAEAIASVPVALPGGAAAADCDTPVKPKETTVAGGLPGLNLAECGDAAKGGEPTREPSAPTPH